MQAIGYKEIVSALRGDISMERAVELIKQNSRTLRQTAVDVVSGTMQADKVV